MTTARGLVLDPQGLDAEQRRSHRQAVRLVIPLALVLAALIAVFGVFFDSSKVDGPSMFPTLHDRDYLLITKGWPDPRPGEVVVFRLADPSTGTVDELVKRVIARAGDRVEVRGDTVIVNGAPEAFPHLKVISARARPRISLTVPPGTVWVMGDNRPVSDDSRDFGPVSLSAMHGKVVAIWAPIGDVRLLPSP